MGRGRVAKAVNAAAAAARRLLWLSVLAGAALALGLERGRSCSRGSERSLEDDEGCALELVRPRTIGRRLTLHAPVV